MHTMREHPSGQWFVGFAANAEAWIPIREFTCEHDAAEYVSYLNGGSAPYFWNEGAPPYFPD